MIPNYVIRETERRLGERLLSRLPVPAQNALAEKAGIDVVASAEPRPSVEESALGLGWTGETPPAFTGAVEFDLELKVLGHSVTHTLRAVYQLTLCTEEDIGNGLPARMVETSTHMLQALLWEEEDRREPEGNAYVRNPFPRWKKIDLFEPDGLPPDVVLDGIFDLIERDALVQEEAGKSTA